VVQDHRGLASLYYSAEILAFNEGVEMKRFIQFAVVLASIVVCTDASANDTTARVGVGGLELTKTENIEMVSEILEISTSRIKVTYRFLNTSDNDITTTVAFPMPAFDNTRAMGRENQRPLDSFQIFVNGALLPVHKYRVFLINNIDMTDKFRKIGLSDNQIFDPEFTCTSFLAEDDFNKSECKLTDEQFAAMRNMRTGGNWQIKETVYWEQTFPAGKEIEVVHEYKPYVGDGGNNHQNFLKNSYEAAKRIFAEVCMDESTFRILSRGTPDFPAKEDGNFSVYFLDVEYVLGTGRNWKGPIKNFKLILKKRAPDDVVSLCFPGKATKTSPITIEFSQTAFVPQDKLVVYFFQRHYERDR
jgi:hypothetical protein